MNGHPCATGRASLWAQRGEVAGAQLRPLSGLLLLAGTHRSVVTSSKKHSRPSPSASYMKSPPWLRSRPRVLTAILPPHTGLQKGYLWLHNHSQQLLLPKQFLSFPMESQPVAPRRSCGISCYVEA